jgi:hypothetical protein
MTSTLSHCSRRNPTTGGEWARFAAAFSVSNFGFLYTLGTVGTWNTIQKRIQGRCIYILSLLFMLKDLGLKRNTSKLLCSVFQRFRKNEILNF